MKIMKVIHGYPMRYNAGSEVYSQTLCHGLAENHHEVHVFTREEDTFRPDFSVREEKDGDDERITLHLVNNPRYKDRYRAEGIDRRFAELLDRIQPDIVHIGHLNHLSTSLLQEAKQRRIPIVFTLHDYWLMCPRGQFMQMFPENPAETWLACDGQEDRKCAERCYARYFGGSIEDTEADVGYWTGWVERRMKHMREMASLVDIFLAPARYLRDRFHRDFGIPESKLLYLDYGFDRERLKGRSRVQREPFTFGYIGTHIPAKGIQHLIEAFGKLNGDARLKIWGRPRGQDTEALQRIAEALPEPVRERIEWLKEYRNQEIVQDVFNHCDAIVVPSIWVENSPLVIHEAQQARVPVITANAGGMAEYVHHEVNGLLFDHRCADALAAQMQRCVDDPDWARRLGAKGYAFSESGDIPSVRAHVREVERIYQQLVTRNRGASAGQAPGPWRVTFDTNPDRCNLKCIMCEEHSEYSDKQVIRIGRTGQKERTMPIALLERVVEDAVPHGLREIIPSTMGEPLLYKDFERILELCRRHGLTLNLTTNGTFPGKKDATRWAELIVPLASDVKISWNAATQETHEAIMKGPASNWEKALKNVRAFIRVRDQHVERGGNYCRVTLQMTFMERNVRELVDIVRLAIHLGVDRLKGHHLWVHDPQIEDESMRRSADSIARWNAAAEAARRYAKDHPLPSGKLLDLENFFPLDPDHQGDIAPDGECPFLGKEAWVSAEGRFDPCCAPDEKRRTLGDFGNLKEAGIMQIWQGKPYQRLTESYRDRDLCRSCNMRKPVQTGAV